MRLFSVRYALFLTVIGFSLVGCNPESDDDSSGDIRAGNLSCLGSICTLDNGAALADAEAALIERELAKGNVILKAAAEQELILASDIEWDSEHSLTLQAANDIRIVGGITATAGKLIIDNPGFDYIVLHPINLSAGPNFRANGKEFTVITSLGSQGSTTGTDLQGIEGNLTANYALGADIDASSTVGWGAVGFEPLGKNDNFSGILEGLGHVISDLHIDAELNYVALFRKPENISIRHLVLNDVYLGGANWIGGFAARPSGTFNVTRSCVIGGTINALYGYVGSFIGVDSDLSSYSINSSCILGTVVKGQNSLGGMIGYQGESPVIDKTYVIQITLEGTPSSNYMSPYFGTTYHATIRNSFHNVKSYIGTLNGSTLGSTEISTEQATIQSTYTNKGWDVSTDPDGDSLWYLDAGENEPPMLRFLDIDLSGYMPTPD